MRLCIDHDKTNTEHIVVFIFSNYHSKLSPSHPTIFDDLHYLAIRGSREGYSRTWIDDILHELRLTFSELEFAHHRRQQFPQTLALGRLLRASASISRPLFASAFITPPQRHGGETERCTLPWHLGHVATGIDDAVSSQNTLWLNSLKTKEIFLGLWLRVFLGRSFCSTLFVSATAMETARAAISSFLGGSGGHKTEVEERQAPAVTR